MEIAKKELAAVEQVVTRDSEHGMTELLDLQLALVGGGIGEVIVG
jgi:hypothetical protein